MSKVSLPFYRNGQPFQPVIRIKDLAAYEAAVEAAVKAKRSSGIYQAAAAFIETAIRNADPSAEVSVDLPLHELMAVYKKVEEAANAPEDVPLGQPTGSERHS